MTRRHMGHSAPFSLRKSAQPRHNCECPHGCNVAACRAEKHTQHSWSSSTSCALPASPSLSTAPGRRCTGRATCAGARGCGPRNQLPPSPPACAKSPLYTTPLEDAIGPNISAKSLLCACGRCAAAAGAASQGSRLAANIQDRCTLRARWLRGAIVESCRCEKRVSSLLSTSIRKASMRRCHRTRRQVWISIMHPSPTPTTHTHPPTPARTPTPTPTPTRKER